LVALRSIGKLQPVDCVCASAEKVHLLGQSTPPSIPASCPALIKTGWRHDTVPGSSDVPAHSFDISVGLLVAARGNNALLPVSLEDKAMIRRRLAALWSCLDLMLIHYHCAVHRCIGQSGGLYRLSLARPRL
jgi:hypothetical protein